MKDMFINLDINGSLKAKAKQYVIPRDRSQRVGAVDQSIINEVIDHDAYEFFNWKPTRVPKFIVDIGAQIGSFSILAAMRFPSATILSYEFNIDNYEHASKNCKNIDNIHIYNRAVIGGRKPVAAFIHPTNSGGHKPIFEGAECYISEETFSTNNKIDYSYNIETINPFEIIENNNIDFIDFLKMDCEGSEYQIIKFMNEKQLLGRIGSLAMELHGHEKENFINILKNNGFNVKTKNSMKLVYATNQNIKQKEN